VRNRQALQPPAEDLAAAEAQGRRIIEAIGCDPTVFMPVDMPAAREDL
jgi:hypothetical protein